jgi:uncharacterized membrane protein
MSFENIVLVIGGTLSGLIAGLYYAFHVAFVPALRAMDPRGHIKAMQELNQRIKNPVFFVTFFGPSLFLPLAAYLHRDTPQFVWLVVASLLHIFGGIGVTVGGNIPLNEALDKVAINQISDAEAERIRQDFQGAGTPWMRFHYVRTITTTVATALILIVCLSKMASK